MLQTRSLQGLSRSVVKLRRNVTCQGSRAKFMVGGNWKCNGTVDSVNQLVSELNDGSVPNDVDIVVAPVAVHIPKVLESIKKPFVVGAQNCWTQGPGAYTGEVTADMLADLGVPWVIIGHSERRALCAETDDVVGVKSAYAIHAGLNVMACVGETLEQRDAGDLWKVLDTQMQSVKKHVQEKDWDKLVIAYEPVWAIGTGRVATPEQAQEVHAHLRKWVTDNVSSETSDSLRILYGGSVKGDNAGTLASQEDIDGFLVGGASLKSDEFLKICNAKQAAAAAA